MFGQGEVGRVAGFSSQYVFVTDTHSYICHICCERYVWSVRGGEGDFSVVELEGYNDYFEFFIFYFSGMQMAEDVRSITGENQLPGLSCFGSRFEIRTPGPLTHFRPDPIQIRIRIHSIAFVCLCS